jgi:hypothetical protein
MLIDEEGGGSSNDAPPLEVVRTSGTFGIQDDGSVHLLIDEPRPITPLSPFTGRPQRNRRDSDNGTVKSAPLGPVLYMGNPDPRQSIDESEESEESRYQHPVRLLLSNLRTRLVRSNPS